MARDYIRLIDEGSYIIPDTEMVLNRELERYRVLSVKKRKGTIEPEEMNELHRNDFYVSELRVKGLLREMLKREMQLERSLK